MVNGIDSIVFVISLRYIKDLLLNPPAYAIASTIQGEWPYILHLYLGIEKGFINLTFGNYALHS